MFKAEARHLPTLSQHCKKLFTGVFLPSHDHLHHARVWSHARSLLLLLDRSGIKIPDTLPEELMIAVFFHDTGLIRTPGEQHGKESRKFCEDFFSEQASGLPTGKSLDRILYAIEHHDDKSLNTSSTRIRPGMFPELLSLLSASDDMDAFGIMGIYRYAEIYLLRGIHPEQLPGSVTLNVRNRFENLQNTFDELTDFIRIQERRFRQVFDFYLSLARASANQNKKPVWESILIGIIYDALQKKQNLLKPERTMSATDFDKEIGNWFKAIDAENPDSEKPAYFT